jgi:small nuclear ribonucleoprotein (snRNP)-like protein
MVSNRLKNKGKVKILLKNNKFLKGFLLGNDKNMNIIMNECEEYKKKNDKNLWEFRKLGFCIIRGDVVVIISYEK